MADKLHFQEKLGGILKKAQDREMRLSKEEVENHFAEDNLSQAQLELVYDYLLAQKVVVKGYVKTGGSTRHNTDSQVTPLTEAEEIYLKEYLSSLPVNEKETSDSRLILFGQAVKGDALAKSKLLEDYLPEVVKIARVMKKEQTSLDDLIQEGNISLMLALDRIGEMGNPEEITDEIRQGIQAFLEESEDIKRRDESMVKKVKNLSEAIDELDECLGRKVSAEELAEYLEITEEEVMDILKLMEGSEKEK